MHCLEKKNCQFVHHHAKAGVVNRSIAAVTHDRKNDPGELGSFHEG